jgi:uncharacterized protein (TIGR02118 family)
MAVTMIGAISLIRRRDDIDTTRFSRHWLDIHGPLVCRMPGLRSYAQSHVGTALTPVGRAMGIDGFAELAFDSVAARAAAYGSAELAECDRDSPDFIGSVSRLVTEAETVVPRPDMPDLAKLIVLFPPGTQANLDALERCAVRRSGGLIWHRVLEQGRAPNSAVPELVCPIAALAELWVTGTVRSPGTPGAVETDRAGVFCVVEHRFR